MPTLPRRPVAGARHAPAVVDTVRTQSEHDSQLLMELGEVMQQVERLNRRTQEAERRDLETSEELQVTE